VCIIYYSNGLALLFYPTRSLALNQVVSGSPGPGLHENWHESNNKKDLTEKMNNSNVYQCFCASEFASYFYQNTLSILEQNT